METDLHSEKQLLDRLNNNAPGAFEQVYRAYVAGLLAYASRRLSSLEEARDVVQDIFLSLYERRNHLNIHGSLKAYLFSALKYKLVDHIRKNIHREYYIDLLLSLPEKGENSVFSELVYNDLNAIVEKEIDRLPSRIKETFLLSRKKHLSIAEIAAYRNISEQTVKNQLTMAVKRLRPVLDKVLLLATLLFFY